MDRVIIIVIKKSECVDCCFFIFFSIYTSIYIFLFFRVTPQAKFFLSFMIVAGHFSSF
jgi:hypothetical protein